MFGASVGGFVCSVVPGGKDDKRIKEHRYKLLLEMKTSLHFVNR